MSIAAQSVILHVIPEYLVAHLDQKKQVQLKEEIICQAGLKLSLTEEKYVTVMQNCNSCNMT